MKQLFGPLLIGLLGLSTTAQAAIVEVSYEGTIYAAYGDGAGYASGDTISGSLFINTDLAPVDSDPHPSIGNYDNKGGNSGFVSGYAEADSRTVDNVHIRDETYNSLDMFSIKDHEWNSFRDNNGNGHYSNKYLIFSAYDYSLDFIQGEGLEQNFELLKSDLLDGFGGTVYDYSHDIVNYQQVNRDEGHAFFSLNRLVVSTTSVPEPSAILLLGAGLAGLGFSRKMNKS